MFFDHPSPLGSPGICLRRSSVARRSLTVASLVARALRNVCRYRNRDSVAADPPGLGGHRAAWRPAAVSSVRFDLQLRHQVHSAEETSASQSCATPLLVWNCRCLARQHCRDLLVRGDGPRLRSRDPFRCGRRACQHYRHLHPVADVSVLVPAIAHQAGRPLSTQTQLMPQIFHQRGAPHKGERAAPVARRRARRTSPVIAGSTNKVSAVEVINPPITTVASGLWTSAPVPVAIAIGTKPSEATRAVISTGRTRSIAPLKIAPPTSSPSSNRPRIDAMRTSPLRTATPDTAIKPTAAETENGISRSAMAKAPPAIARGTAVKTVKANGMLPSAMYRAPAIKTMQIGTTNCSRRTAR